MAIEIGARCGRKPDPATTARVAALVMRAALGRPGIDGVADVREHAWHVRWGDTTTAVAIIIEPGRHEFGENWFLTVHPGARGVDLHLLPAIVVAASAALTTDGVVLDETRMLDGGTDHDGAKEHDPAALLDRLLVSDKHDASTALRALNVTDPYIDEA